LFEHDLRGVILDEGYTNLEREGGVVRQFAPNPDVERKEKLPRGCILSARSVVICIVVPVTRADSGGAAEMNPVHRVLDRHDGVQSHPGQYGAPKPRSSFVDVAILGILFAIMKALQDRRSPWDQRGLICEALRKVSVILLHDVEDRFLGELSMIVGK
jgi:hypothetical protein